MKSTGQVGDRAALSELLEPAKRDKKNSGISYCQNLLLRQGDIYILKGSFQYFFQPGPCCLVLLGRNDSKRPQLMESKYWARALTADRGAIVRVKCLSTESAYFASDRLRLLLSSWKGSVRRRRGARLLLHVRQKTFPLRILSMMLAAFIGKTKHM